MGVASFSEAKLKSVFTASETSWIAIVTITVKSSWVSVGLKLQVEDKVTSHQYLHSAKHFLCTIRAHAGPSAICARA